MSVILLSCADIADIGKNMEMLATQQNDSKGTQLSMEHSANELFANAALLVIQFPQTGMMIIKERQ